MLLPDTTSVTATSMSSNPAVSFAVRTSSNTKTPKITAVTGSNTPNMAVAVDPIYCMATVVHISETAVGRAASASASAHMAVERGTARCPDMEA